MTMRITDPVRARSAFTLLLVAAGVNFGAYLLQSLLSRLTPSLFGTPSEIALQVIWLGIAGLYGFALVQLASAVDEPTLPWAAVALVGLNAAIDIGYAVLSLTGNYGMLGPLGTPLSGITMLLGLVERGLILWILVSFATPRFSWTMPIAATMLLVSTARYAFSFAVSLQLVDGMKLFESGVYALVTTVVGLFTSSMMLVIAWFARVAVLDFTNGIAPTIPPQEHGLYAAPVVEQPASAGADFAIGAVILGIGVAVTFISVSTASNGGRYIVATGAIAVGLARIIRGFIRLARQQR